MKKKETLNDFVEFNDPKLQQLYKNHETKIPMSQLIEGYVEGRIDIVGDLKELLQKRDIFINYSLITKRHFRFLFNQLIPEIGKHPRKKEKKKIRPDSDHGTDFFSAFLGPRMVYASAFFKNNEESLEKAQDQNLDLVCQKLQMKKGDEHLDIGCGWGALTLHSAKNYHTHSTGITLAQHQTIYGNEQILKEDLSKRAQILCMDYRELPTKMYNKISCLEMAEWTSTKNFKKVLSKIYSLLSDDGLFYLQIANLRRSFQPEDLEWGLFMNQYIFSDFKANMPISLIIDRLEKVGFEIHSVENIGFHYSLTLQRWYDNWMRNRSTIVSSYGEQWFRVWHLFLGWSALIAAQGSATCFQILCNKNLNTFNRQIWIGKPALGEQKFFYNSAKDAPREILQNLPTSTSGPQDINSE